MYKNRIYQPNDKMSDLIGENYTLLQVFSRFGLTLGFGDKTVKEVCDAKNVDCNTFLIVVNFLIEDSDRLQEHVSGLSLTALMDYLRRSHHYFLDFQLPSIRRKLIEAINCAQEAQIAFLIIKFFDAYVDEVRKHMEYEDIQVFTYVEKLLKGEETELYNIGVYSRHHDKINEKLTELKNIIIKYYPATENNELLNSVLFDIYTSESDLASHNKIEDYLFVPAILEMEKEKEEK